MMDVRRIGRPWRWLMLLVVLAMLAAACAEDAGDDADTPDETEPAADADGDEPIRIGGIGPLSEPGAVSAGIDMQWAMELAVADINADGGVLGRPLELRFEDTQNMPEAAVSVAKKLIEEDEVAAVVGEYHSGAALAAIPEYTEAGMPVLFAEPWADAVTGGDPDDPDNLPEQPATIFRIAPTVSYWSDFAVDWLVNGISAEKVVQVYESTDYGLGANDQLGEQLTAEGVEYVGVEVELNLPDYTAVLTRIGQEHADADVISTGGVTGDSHFTLTQNAFDAGLFDDGAVCYANIDASQTASWWSAVPDGAGCAFVYIGPAPAAYNDTTTRVAEAYEAEFDDSPGAWVFESYDGILLVADAIERAGTTESAAVVEALESTSLVGAQGEYSVPYNSSNPDTPEGEPWMWHQFPDPAISLVQYTERDQTLEDAAIIWPESAQTHGSAYVTP